MNGRQVAGVLLLILGVGFLLDQMNVLDFHPFLQTWWPAALIILGAAQFIINRTWSLGAGILVIVGGVLLADNLLDLSFDVWDLLWPAVLILIGLRLLFRRRPRAWQRSNAKAGSPNEVHEDRISRMVAFGGLDATITARPFRGGSLTACFGGIELDLTGTELPPEGATLDCTACFGGIEVHVPRSWRVEAKGMPLFGGFDTSETGGDADSPVLRITGTAIFGGIDVNTKHARD